MPVTFSQARESPVDLYEAIFSRRDIRQFKTEAVPAEAFDRILNAAHHAGSVGFMQPWNFVVIRDLATKQQVKAAFEVENRRAAENYQGERRTLYESLKLEGILEAPINLCVTCDRSRGGKVLGRNSILDTDLFSTCCAVQNLWLAARAEGIGVGWVSIVDNQVLGDILGLPEGVVPVAYLCVGYPVDFPPEPLLQTVGWGKRLPVEDLVFHERFGQKRA